VALAIVAAGCMVVGAAVEQPATVDSVSTIKKNIEMVFCFIGEISFMNL
jgi:hypothetical protein